MFFRKPCHMPFRKLIRQLTYREYRREGPYFVLSFRLLLFCVLCGVTKSNCLKLVLDKVKSTRAMEWVKSEFQIEFNIKLNWFIHKRFANLSNHFQFLLPSSIKRLGTKGEQIAIHQLNNFNKAWMNTNLAKTPTLFTVKFQELLEIFWETYLFNSQEFFTFSCINSYSSLAKRGFLYETGYPPGFTFSSSVLYVFFLNRSTANKRGSIWRDILEIEANAVKYIHTYIFTSWNLKWGWLRAQATQAGHVRDLN